MIAVFKSVMRAMQSGWIRMFKGMLLEVLTDLLSLILARRVILNSVRFGEKHCCAKKVPYLRV